MLGAGGIFVVALSTYFGRLPVFWFSIFAFITAAWSAAAKGFRSFEVARILHGFFSTVTQANGLMFIKDTSFSTSPLKCSIEPRNIQSPLLMILPAAK